MPEDVSHPLPKSGYLVAFAIVLLGLGYVLYLFLRAPSAPSQKHPAAEQPPGPMIAPLAQPVLKNFEDVADYTGGKPLPSAPAPDVFVEPVTDKDHMRGDPAAPVTIVEYAALGSLYTQLIHAKLIDFVATNKDKVNWVFRHFPRSDNQTDYRAGQAAECIARDKGNDAFWSFLDLIMKDRGNAMDENYLVTKGVSVGADESKLRSCIHNTELYDILLIQKGHAEGDANIFVEPSFVFVNRQTDDLRIVEGLNTMEYLQGVLQDISK